MTSSARAAIAATPGHASDGVTCLDTGGNPRIGNLMEMEGALSRARQPQELRTSGGRMPV